MAKIIHLKKSKPKPKYKYTLEDQLNALPRGMSIGEVEKHLKQYGIGRDAFYNDRRIVYGSESSIPSDRLFIYSKVFDVPLADLLNHEIKAKSIREKNLKLKTGLV